MKRIVLLSGGIDSTTCLAMAIQDKSTSEVIALNCFYGQKNAKEMQSARNVANYYGVPLIEMDISQNFRYSNCPMLIQSTEKIMHRSYKDQTQETKGDTPISSYVPFRNGVMLSIAVAIAYSLGAKEVWYGAHADDAEGNAYPDCSVEFIENMNLAVIEGTASKVRVVAPLKKMRKKEVVKYGIEHKVPYELTWSCYESGEHPCGKCGTCLAIEEAFEANGVKYPVK